MSTRRWLESVECYPLELLWLVLRHIFATFIPFVAYRVVQWVLHSSAVSLCLFISFLLPLGFLFSHTVNAWPVVARSTIQSIVEDSFWVFQWPLEKLLHQFSSASTSDYGYEWINIGGFRCGGADFCQHFLRYVFQLPYLCGATKDGELEILQNNPLWRFILRSDGGWRRDYILRQLLQPARILSQNVWCGMDRLSAAAASRLE